MQRVFRVGMAKVLAGIMMTAASMAGSTGFSFDYKVEGTHVIQAFDDGVKTYIQMRSDHLPVVSDGMDPALPVARTGLYYTVPLLANVLTVSAGGSTATIHYTGKQIRPRRATPVSQATRQPLASPHRQPLTDPSPSPASLAASPSAPLPDPDQVKPVLLTVEDEAALTTTRTNLFRLVDEGSLAAEGANLALDAHRTKLLSRRAQLIADAERAAKEAAAQRLQAERDAQRVAALKTNSATTVMALDAHPDTPCFDVLPSDVYLSVAMSRWAKQAGWQGPFWEASDPVVERSARICGDVFVAINQVLSAYAQTTHSIRLVFHEGNNTPQFVTGAK
ncbi:TcpQ domain-containing protein [Chitinimonas sp. BJB300]|uniref:TcpQ domain-containing protein n=1 Tax=Chitinimonas sp. BJB300 TaxID=1559339 RepID=UPI000C10A292|nr:TcpQ domain-containing protein [Chitinimonas sp. BJB300]PHV12036.1 hypothetical protein CSQ89_07800 [Chitinimonas sp. BJB300]TSJ84927.1 hypothetical protein FG002_018385 [Chitinimonas sp. BJB300]